DRPADVGEASLELKNQGITAVKMNATEELQYIDSYGKVDRVLERVDSIRRSCGADFGIGIDFHGRVHKPMAKVLARELEQFRPRCREQRAMTEKNEKLRDIAMHTAIAIAT